MKKSLKILSIDWDYFIDATLEQRVALFPDGNDRLGNEINKIVWQTRYGSEGEELSSIRLDEESFNSTMDYLYRVRNNHLSPYVNTVITNSHKYLYYFVTEHSTSDRPIKMFHIDYHTDSYGYKEEVDCGNWVDHLDKYLDDRARKFSTIKWLGRYDSEENINSPKLIKRTDIDGYIERTVDKFFHGNIPDLIFICKSNQWSPPHLDDHFDKMSELAKKIGHVRYTNFIENRYTDKFKRNCEELRKATESVMKPYGVV
jgi:hypothetical protein